MYKFGITLKLYKVILALFLSLIASSQSQAETIVRVLGYPFPPFINEDRVSGLTPDLIEVLNKAQDDYLFVLTVSAPKRRFYHIAGKQHDVLFFEMPQWGWEKGVYRVDASREIMHGGEVYITKRKEDRDQSYFEELKSKKISAYYGYHYGFADFNADRSWLEKNFKIGLHHSHARIIELVRKMKVDIGVVTLSYLREYLVKYPEVDGDLLISEKLDQVYKLPALVRRGGPIDVKEIERLLDDLKASGKLQDLFQRHGLIEQLSY